MSGTERRARLHELQALLQERSIAKGSFTLTSGAHSHYYCDTKATVLSPRGSRLIGEALCARLRPFGVEAVGGPEVGGAYLATAASVASDMEGPPLFGFLVRNKAKGHGTSARIDASYHSDGRKLIAEGRRVAVVDDVVTSAGSILRAIEAVQDEGCEVVAVSAVVDRQEGGGELLRSRGFDFRPLFVADSEGNLSVYSGDGR